MSSDADPVHPKEGLVVRAKRMLEFQFHDFNKTELRIKLNKLAVILLTPAEKTEQDNFVQ